MRWDGLREAALEVMKAERRNGSDMEAIAMSERETTVQAGCCLLEAGNGRMGDAGNPDRPWVFLGVETEAEVKELRRAFGVGRSKPKRNGDGWKLYAYGNDALVILAALVGAGVRSPHSGRARQILQVWGRDGKPWDSEYQRLRAERGLDQEGRTA